LEESGTAANFALDNIYWDSPAAIGLLGDYNDNGVVDAADYTVWRDAKESGGVLLNDPTPGVIDDSDYVYWRSHFGESLDGGAGSEGATVPEPASLGLLMMALVAGAARIRR
jgi:hypothetical protein